MEEILSSIRRIIADEEHGGDAGTRRADRPFAPEGDDDADVLELTDVVEHPTGPEPAAAPAEVPPPPPPPAHTLHEEARPMTGQHDSGLLSSGAAAASAEAMARLTRAMAPEERPQPGPAAGITVEELVKELMAPVVRDWLEKNLPAVVERVVEQEVKKLARRAEML